MASIVSVNRSTQKGTIKLPVLELYLLADEGAEGDAHAGHWHRQLSLLAEESIESMRDLGVEGLTPGIFAENITTKGLCLHIYTPAAWRMCSGDHPDREGMS